MKRPVESDYGISLDNAEVMALTRERAQRLVVGLGKRHLNGLLCFTRHPLEGAYSEEDRVVRFRPVEACPGEFIWTVFAHSGFAAIHEEHRTSRNLVARLLLGDADFEVEALCDGEYKRVASLAYATSHTEDRPIGLQDQAFVERSVRVLKREQPRLACPGTIGLPLLFLDSNELFEIGPGAWVSINLDGGRPWARLVLDTKDFPITEHREFTNSDLSVVSLDHLLTGTNVYDLKLERGYHAGDVVATKLARNAYVWALLPQRSARNSDPVVSAPIRFPHQRFA